MSLLTLTASASSPQFVLSSTASEGLTSILAAMQTLGSAAAAADVAFALNHQVKPCEAEWPHNIEPTVPEIDVFFSACYLLQSPMFSPFDKAYILSRLPALGPTPPGASPDSRAAASRSFGQSSPLVITRGRYRMLEVNPEQGCTPVLGSLSWQQVEANVSNARGNPLFIVYRDHVAAPNTLAGCYKDFPQGYAWPLD
jgi:hypothetical protein